MKIINLVDTGLTTLDNLKPLFVLLYSNNCKFCIDAKREFNDLCNNYEPIVQLAAMNIDSLLGNERAIFSFNKIFGDVKGVPAFILLTDNFRSVYKGHRTAANMYAFLQRVKS